MTGAPGEAGEEPGVSRQDPPPAADAWQQPAASAGSWQAPATPSSAGSPPPGSWQAPSGAAGPTSGSPASWSPPPVATGPAAGITYAGFVIRLVAYIVDGIILLIPNAILGFIFLASAVTISVSQSGARVGVDYGGLLIVTILELAISAAYFVYTWTRLRASPGDRLFGLMVLNAADGSPLTMNQALVRWVVLAGPSALSSIVTAGTGGLGGLVGLLILFWYVYLAWTTATDPRRQGFHDKWVRWWSRRRSCSGMLAGDPFRDRVRAASRGGVRGRSPQAVPAAGLSAGRLRRPSPQSVHVGARFVDEWRAEPVDLVDKPVDPGAPGP